MGVYFQLAYGVALTDQFGEKLRSIPQELMTFGQENEDNEELGVIQAMPTGGDYFLVLGVNVNQGAKEGETWTDGKDTLKEIHQQYLNVLARCPAHVQRLIEDGGLVPRLCVLAGNF